MKADICVHLNRKVISTTSHFFLQFALEGFQRTSRLQTGQWRVSEGPGHALQHDSQVRSQDLFLGFLREKSLQILWNYENSIKLSEYLDRDESILFVFVPGDFQEMFYNNIIHLLLTLKMDIFSCE